MQDAPSVNTTGRRYPQQMPADRHRNDGDDDDDEGDDGDDDFDVDNFADDACANCSPA